MAGNTIGFSQQGQGNPNYQAMVQQMLMGGGQGASPRAATGPSTPSSMSFGLPQMRNGGTGSNNINAMLQRLGPNLGGRNQQGLMGMLGINPLTGGQAYGDGSKTPAQRLFGSSGMEPNFIDKLAYIISGKSFNPTMDPATSASIPSTFQNAPVTGGLMDPSYGSTFNLEGMNLMEQPGEGLMGGLGDFGEDFNLDFMSPWEI